MLQCVAVCCSAGLSLAIKKDSRVRLKKDVLQCVAVYYSEGLSLAIKERLSRAIKERRVAVCCSVLRCVAVKDSLSRLKKDFLAIKERLFENIYSD